MSKKILYLHGRPEPHKLHSRFAKSLGSDFLYVDFKFRWQDEKRSILFRIFSWVICAFKYPKNYDYYLVDNLHMPPVIMKKLRLISKETKIIAHLGSHTLYFMYSNWYSRIVNFLHKYMLKNYDILLCEGQMAEELVKELLNKNAPPTYYTFLGPPAERMSCLKGVKPSLESKAILHISSGPGGFRTYYKGIYQMVEAFGQALEHDASLTFTIVGDWDSDVRAVALGQLKENHRKSLKFAGKVENIEDFMQASSLYLHCSNGDAFPTASVEAMTAGLVPLVSEWTGTKQIVDEIDTKLVVPMDSQEISKRILWYFELSTKEKEKLSITSREASKNFTEEESIRHYKSVFDLISQQE